MQRDFVIIGGGISGAAAAYFLSAIGSVALLERETQFGEHSSGRTAGQYTVGITADRMRAMAGASRAFFTAPPEGFAETALVSPRGSLTVARSEQKAVLERLDTRVREVGGTVEKLDRAGAMALFPALREDHFDCGLYEVDALDVDVNTLLQGYLRGARQNGAVLATGVEIGAVSRREGIWHIETGVESYQAPVLVNAAGAWADTIAALAGQKPIGITPYRRTAFTFSLLPESVGAEWPHVTTADYSWYVKPEAGCFMGSPADAVAVEPGEMYPDYIDVAQGIHNIEQDTTLTVSRPLSSWAGMRSFVRDRNPVCGARADAPGFIWFTGQGGCGVLTSPAMGQALAAVAQNVALPDAQVALGLTAQDLSPEREGLIAA
tara:strand:- start:4173 stop:5306 length:1134 start_codon:yes stop_codon:yes gene_type:complete